MQGTKDGKRLGSYAYTPLRKNEKDPVSLGQLLVIWIVKIK